MTVHRCEIARHGTVDLQWSLRIVGGLTGTLGSFSTLDTFKASGSEVVLLVAGIEQLLTTVAFPNAFEIPAGFFSADGRLR